MRSLRNAVVVVTGASSGIGRATALAFAREGARVVLAARRPDALEEAAEECRRTGAEALAVPTDVADEVAVGALAGAAIEAFGRIDVWVNNTGVGIVGPYWEAPIAMQRRVVETNLIGTMNGASAVLPHFIGRKQGVLLNMVSMGGWSATPYASAYAASKFGIRGFSASLRAELAPFPGIRVGAVFPALVDTPGLAHGANVSGRAINPAGPFIAPEAVARVFVRLAKRPRDEVAVGWPSTAARIGFALAPGLTTRLTGAAMRAALRRARPAPRTEGAVMAPVPEGREASGGFRTRHPLTGTGTRLALGGLGLLLGAELLSRAVGRRA